MAVLASLNRRPETTNVWTRTGRAQRTEASISTHMCAASRHYTAIRHSPFGMASRTHASDARCWMCVGKYTWRSTAIAIARYHDISCVFSNLKFTICCLCLRQEPEPASTDRSDDRATTHTHRPRFTTAPTGPQATRVLELARNRGRHTVHMWAAERTIDTLKRRLWFVIGTRTPGHGPRIPRSL